MCRNERYCYRARRLLWTLPALIALAGPWLLDTVPVASAAERRSKAATDSPVPRRPKRVKAAGEPLRLAVLTVRSHTPILTHAYARFRQAHGRDKLSLEIWSQEDWAESPRPLEMASYDMILALRCSIPNLEEAVSAAAAGGTWVVSSSDTKYRDCAVWLDSLPDLAPYYRERGVSNMIGLLERACELFQVPGVKARPAEDSVTMGIYHPDAPAVFADAKSYWKWYASRPGYDPQAPKVGVFVYNTLFLNEETDYFTQLVRVLEEAKANPVLGFWFMPVGKEKATSSPVTQFFDGVDVLLSSSFRLILEKPWHDEELRKLNVPVLNSIILNTDQEEWRHSNQGVPASYLLFGIVAPEISGLIEPTVIAARQPVTHPDTKQRYYRTVVVEDNYRWQVRRALAWARLRRAEPEERRVAILYYNHGGGKQNIGASYLNVTASLECILTDLTRRGYGIEGAPDRQRILDSMLAVGRNVGSWAPAMLERLSEDAVLWPVEDYLAYYDRLPDRARQEISRQWGQPPGDVMTVTRNGQPFLVLPAFQMGNVLLAPQPSRAMGPKHAGAYHDPDLWPPHQYLAFYLWLRHAWKAHAVVHLGRHGTLEFLPGKSQGLPWDDPPGLLLGELPNLYPYIVDGIGEAVAAKRRGQALLLTHATPPLSQTKAYGELSRLRQLVGNYLRAREQRQAGLQKQYLASIVELATSLGYQVSQGHYAVAKQESKDAEISPVQDEQIEDIEHWIDEIEEQTAPRGLHTFGQPYTAEATQDMLPHMFRDELEQIEKQMPEATTRQDWLGRIVQKEAPPPPVSQPAAPTASKSKRKSAKKAPAKDPRARIAATAWYMRHNQELDYLARGLDAGFIPVGPPGDPLSNPDIFPTGRNQYQHDPRKMPTREAWAVGQRMAEQMLQMHRQRHGELPQKVSVTLWANTLIRTDGALECEVLYLLGVEPVWNRRGDLDDVKLVSPLGRPRVDVVMTVTGMYRDSFPDKILLLDKAVRLAHAAPAESGQPNHLQQHVQEVTRELIGKGTKREQSEQLALLRIFGAKTGVYGTGVDGFVKASESWSERAQVAQQYLQRMSFAFSEDGWSQPAPDLFRRQLRGVRAVVHGRSSNLYGIMDLTEAFEYQGGLALAVEQLDGKPPELYVNDLVRGQRVRDGRQAIVLELLSRYHNPEFIRAMMADGYDGARYFSRIADNQFGWDVVSDAITASDWKEYADIYLADKHQLGLPDFFEKHNPHALQNIASRVLETDSKSLQQLDSETLALAATAYVRSVAQHGPSCSSHVCANPDLNHRAQELAAATQQLDEETMARFRRQLQRTGNAETIAGLNGASSEPASAPQPVQGQVLQPPPPAASASTQEQESATTQSAATAKASTGQSPASRPVAMLKHRTPAIAAVLLCLTAFVLGLLWRSYRFKESDSQRRDSDSSETHSSL